MTRYTTWLSQHAPSVALAGMVIVTALASAGAAIVAWTLVTVTTFAVVVARLGTVRDVVRYPNADPKTVELHVTRRRRF